MAVSDVLTIEVSGHAGQFRMGVQICSNAAVTALYGRSGAGKTTLLRAVAGLWRPDRGFIRVGGRVLFDSEAGIDVSVHERRLGVVFQSPLLFPHMSVERNLRYGIKEDAEGVWRETMALLDLTSLLGRHPRTLSGGEQQRVALGRALLSSPDLLLLDEPMTGLDDYRRGQVMPYLQAIRDTCAVPMLYVSHHREEIAALADRVFLIDKGQVRAEMAPQDLRSFSLTEPST